MTPEQAFDELMNWLKSGNQDAAKEVVDRFTARLIGLARVNLNERVRTKVDAEDVVQSVFRSFFLRQAGGQFTLESWDSLWGLLVVITLRKCHRKTRHFFGARRDIRKETFALAPDEKSGSNSGWEIVDREPTPDEAAALAETVEALMNHLDERDRAILELRLQGHTVPEISKQVGRTEFTVAASLKRVRKQLRALREAEPEAP